MKDACVAEHAGDVLNMDVDLASAFNFIEHNQESVIDDDHPQVERDSCDDHNEDGTNHAVDLQNFVRARNHAESPEIFQPDSDEDELNPEDGQTTEVSDYDSYDETDPSDPSDDENDGEVVDQSLEVDQLREWAIRYNVKGTAVDALLAILKRRIIPNICRSCKTLLKTSEAKYTIENMTDPQGNDGELSEWKNNLEFM